MHKREQACPISELWNHFDTLDKSKAIMMLGREFVFNILVVKLTLLLTL
jgi:hypothetical protein